MYHHEPNTEEPLIPYMDLYSQAWREMEGREERLARTKAIQRLVDNLDKVSMKDLQDLRDYIKGMKCKEYRVNEYGILEETR